MSKTNAGVDLKMDLKFWPLFLFLHFLSFCLTSPEQLSEFADILTKPLCLLPFSSFLLFPFYLSSCLFFSFLSLIFSLTQSFLPSFLSYSFFNQKTLSKYYKDSRLNESPMNMEMCINLPRMELDCVPDYMYLQ